jgi:hypothetical protein
MTDAPADTTTLDPRILRLEKQVRSLRTCLLILVVLGVSGAIYNVTVMRRVLVTESFFTRELNIPSPKEWSALGVSGGIAPAIDGKSITIWLAGSPFAQAHHQLRIELDAAGSERIDLIDKNGKPRLRLGIATDGSPSINLLGPKGESVWRAPSL